MLTVDRCWDVGVYDERSLESAVVRKPGMEYIGEGTSVQATYKSLPEKVKLGAKNVTALLSSMEHE